MTDICAKYDFMITMGISDANPTTILESMSWGLPVVCTPQSGYYKMDTIFTITHSDAAHNRDLIARLEQMPEEQLRDVCNRNREIVAEHYTWDIFCSTIDSIITRVIENKTT